MRSAAARRNSFASFIAVLLTTSAVAACSDGGPPAATAPLAPSESRSSADHIGPMTRYVSPSGADVGSCTKTAPCRTIHFAVATANAGDEISVAHGTYHEVVMVAKQLSLVGHDATVDAAGQASPPNGIVIVGSGAAGTSVRGFTVRNAGLEGIFVNKTAHITIEKNTVVDNDAFGPNNPLCAAQPDDCGEAIHLQTVTSSVVRHNLVQNNVGGILLTDEDGPTFDNQIADNRVLDNTKDCGITLASHHFNPRAAATPDVAGIYHNVVVHNVANGNGAAGIGVFAGPPGAAAWGNTVVNNTAKNNGNAGIMIHSHTPAQYVDKNVIVGNVLAKNSPDPDNPFSDKPTGISIFSAVIPIPHTVVADNRISDEYYGINIVNAQKVSGLKSNRFAKSVTVPVVTH
jgi:hypothetical protein